MCCAKLIALTRQQDLLKHSNEQASELKLEKSRSASMRGSPRLSPHPAGAGSPGRGGDAEQQVTELLAQLRLSSEQKEQLERKNANLLETNKALLSRLNDLAKSAKKT